MHTCTHCACNDTKVLYDKGMSRLSIPQYVMALAHVAALRSEDPYRKVGAAAFAATMPERAKRANMLGSTIS